MPLVTQPLTLSLLLLFAAHCNTSPGNTSPGKQHCHVKQKHAVCRDGPSQLVILPEDSIRQLDSSCIDIPWALQELAQQTAADSIIPGHNCCGVFATAGRPCMPSGKLTRMSMCAVIVHVQPSL
ncbi:TPA: hypothetical protein ACH3X2_014065 [Trebouxia sp. C0005]